MSDLVQISHSRLSMASKCGEMLRRRYVEHERIPPGFALVRGRSVDEAANRNLQSKMEGSGLLSLPEVQQIARDAVHYELAEGGLYLTDEEAEKPIGSWRDELVDEAVSLSTLHACEVAPALDPVAIQWRWETSIKGYDVRVVGVVDVAEEAQKHQTRVRALRDLKTTGKRPSPGTADKSLQLTLYALADYVHQGQLPDAVVLDNLVNQRRGGPAYVPQISTRTKEHFGVVLRRIEEYVTAWNAGVFLPADPDISWWCSEKWCGYYRTCRFVHRPYSVAV